jgi:two-component system, cell cycle response regulator DivK
MSSSKVHMQINPKILVVEDNRVNQLLLLKKFEQQGFRSVSLAMNGQEALDMARKNNPDLILMDIQLPDMNGNEVIRNLRNVKFPGAIVAVSADSLKKDMDASLAAGANGYITKPIDYDTFFAKINGFLQLPDDPHPLRINASISDAAKNVFIADAQEKLQLLAEALEHAGDEEQMKKIKAIAHEYKGNAGYFGLKELEGIARELDTGLANDQPREYLLELTRKLVAVVKGIIDESN